MTVPYTSRDSYTVNLGKLYDKLVQQQGQYLLDATINEIQDILRAKIRNAVLVMHGEGSFDAGGEVVESAVSNVNNLTISAGTIVNEGEILSILAALEFDNQDILFGNETSVQGLTTPSGGDRTDDVYLIMRYRVVDEVEDPDLIEDRVGLLQGRNNHLALKIEFGVRVDEGQIGTGSWSWYEPTESPVLLKIAELARLDGDATITTAMITDSRAIPIQFVHDEIPGIQGSGTNHITDDQMDAADSAASPSASNPFATLADISGLGGWQAPVVTATSLPTVGNNTGDLRWVEDEETAYRWDDALADQGAPYYKWYVAFSISDAWHASRHSAAFNDAMVITADVGSNATIGAHMADAAIHGGGGGATKFSELVAETLGTIHSWSSTGFTNTETYLINATFETKDPAGTGFKLTVSSDGTESGTTPTIFGADILTSARTGYATTGKVWGARIQATQNSATGELAALYLAANNSVAEASRHGACVHMMNLSSGTWGKMAHFHSKGEMVLATHNSGIPGTKYSASAYDIAERLVLDGWKLSQIIDARTGGFLGAHAIGSHMVETSADYDHFLGTGTAKENFFRVSSTMTANSTDMSYIRAAVQSHLTDSRADTGSTGIIAALSGWTSRTLAGNRTIGVAGQATGAASTSYAYGLYGACTSTNRLSGDIWVNSVYAPLGLRFNHKLGNALFTPLTDTATEIELRYYTGSVIHDYAEHLSNDTDVAAFMVHNVPRASATQKNLQVAIAGLSNDVNARALTTVCGVHGMAHQVMVGKSGYGVWGVADRNSGTPGYAYGGRFDGETADLLLDNGTINSSGNPLSLNGVNLFTSAGIPSFGGLIRNYGIAANGQAVNFLTGAVTGAASTGVTLSYTPTASFNGSTGAYGSAPFVICIPMVLPRFNDGGGALRAGLDYTGIDCHAASITVNGFSMVCKNYNNDDPTGRGGWAYYIVIGA